MNGLDIGAETLVDDFADDSTYLSQTQRASALSNKITHALATSYTDSEIRDALAALDVQNIKNTPEARRRLRIDTQKDVLSSNGAIIRDFGGVAEQLKQVGSLIKALNNSVSSLQSHVSTANKDVVPMLQEADGILRQKREIETKQRLLDAFNKHYRFSDDELAILTSSTLPVDDHFFVLLNKLKKVHTDCQVLLGSEDQQLGLELMAQTSRTLDGTYEKLFRWIQKEFKTLNLENPRMHAPIRRALRVLAQKPSLFKDCMDFFAETRERNLTDAFYGALTGSTLQTDDRTTKPMEYFAHDPLRFIGDMLAWLHSATVSERESLEVLFITDGQEIARGLAAGVEGEPWSQQQDEVFDGKKTLEILINKDFAGVVKALRLRIEQVIRSDDDAVLAYRIANLIEFYRVTLVRLVGTESSVREMLGNLQELALQQYRTAMTDHANLIPTDSSLVPTDLDPPDFLADALVRLQEIVKTYEASYAAEDDREANLGIIFDEALEPFKQACLQMASGLQEPMSSIFSINCLSTIKSAASRQEFPASRLEELDDSIEKHSAALIEYQYEFFKQTSGLATLLAAIAPLTTAREDLLALYKLEQFQPQPLADSSQVMNDFLYSAVAEAGENLKQLRDPGMVEQITAEAVAQFCEDFDEVEERLVAADELLEQHDDVLNLAGERPQPLRSIFQRTSADIRILLS